MYSLTTRQHMALVTLRYLWSDPCDTLSPPNSPDLNPVDYTELPYSTLLSRSGAWLLHGLVCSSMSSTKQLTTGEVAAHLCKNWWSTLQTFALIIWTVFLVSWQLSDVTIWLLVGDFIFDTVLVLYAVKIIVSFYKVQYKHIKRYVVGCVYGSVSNSLGVCFCQELSKLYDIWLSCHKFKNGSLFSEKQCTISRCH